MERVVFMGGTEKDQNFLFTSSENRLDFEREGSQTYNIEVLWQQRRNLGLIFAANSQVKPGEPSQLLPNECISSAFSLSNIP